MSLSCLFQDDPSQDIYYAYNNIIINGVGTQGFEHHQSYILEKLMPDSMYEAQIQARNHYGWSAVSDKFQFYTRAYGEFNRDLGVGKRVPTEEKCITVGIR